MTEAKNASPLIDWKDDRIHVVLPKDGKPFVEAHRKPSFTYIVRIRKLNSDQWSIGFETPFGHCGFVGLEPNADYEMEISRRNSTWQSKPDLVQVRTNHLGELVD